MGVFMKYKYILFDLDGTITDPKEGITKSVQYALEHFEISGISLDDLEGFIGPPLKESFMEFHELNEKQVTKAIDYYRERFAIKGMYENKVYPGIPELLKALKAQGATLAVATSKPTVFAKKILEHFRLIHFFDIVIGSNLDYTRTDKGEVIAYTLNQLNVQDLDQVIMIGDRKFDIIGANQNQIHSIAADYGYGTDEEFKSITPTYRVKKVEEIMSILSKG